MSGWYVSIRMFWYAMTVSYKSASRTQEFMASLPIAWMLHVEIVTNAWIGWSIAVRPSAISPGAVREARHDNAERMITEAFSSILKDGADDWVPGAGPHRGQCRVSGESSRVIHTNDFDTLYPACLSYYDWTDREFYSPGAYMIVTSIVLMHIWTRQRIKNVLMYPNFSWYEPKFLSRLYRTKAHI
jgi:hypothetical protein